MSEPKTGAVVQVFNPGPLSRGVVTEGPEWDKGQRWVRVRWDDGPPECWSRTDLLRVLTDEHETENEG